MVLHSCKNLGGITHKAWCKLFFACFMDIIWFAAIYPASSEKYQLGSKATKIATPLHIISVKLLCCSAQVECFYILTMQGNE